MSNDSTSVDSDSESSSDLILTSQFDQYQHLQNQTQRILRIYIALVAVIVALVGSGLIQRPIVPPVPTKTITIEAGAVELNGMYKSIAENSRIIGGVAMAGGILLILDSLRPIYKILVSEPLYPLMGNSVNNRPARIDGPRIGESEITQYVRQNDQRLRDLNRLLRSLYGRIVQGITLFVFGFVSFISAYSLSGDIIVLSNVLVVLVPIIFAIDRVVSLTQLCTLK
jgi:hypothetical protein